MSHINEIIQDIFDKKRSTDKAFSLMMTKSQDEISHDELQELIDTIEMYENSLHDFRIKLRLLNNKQYLREMLTRTR